MRTFTRYNLYGRSWYRAFDPHSFGNPVKREIKGSIFVSSFMHFFRFLLVIAFVEHVSRAWTIPGNLICPNIVYIVGNKFVNISFRIYKKKYFITSKLYLYI